MYLKVFYFSFINLLVALAVYSANASPSIENKYLIESEKAYKNEIFLDNQFELKPDYGFYYREKIGLFEFFLLGNESNAEITKKITKYMYINEIIEAINLLSTGF